MSVYKGEKMKILTNWSTAGRAAVAAMMLTASAAGVTSCFNSNNQNSRTQIEDVFVKEKVQDISYNNNEALIHRHLDKYKIEDSYNKWCQEYRDIFQERGLYGGTLYLQRREDLNRNVFCSFLLHKLAEKGTERESNRIYSWDSNEEHYNTPLLKEAYKLKQINKQLSYEFANPRVITWEDLSNNYFTKYLQKLDNDLFMDGNPTWQECSNYLDRQIAGLDFLSQRDYEKCKRDIAKFEKAQKKHDDIAIAELLAYKQYKLDTLTFVNMYKELGLLDNYEYRRLYDKFIEEKYFSRPKINE